MDTPYQDMPLGPADDVPLSVFVGYPGQEKVWLQMATGQHRLAMNRQTEANNDSHRRAMKKVRAWRKSVYERSLAAIRLMDLGYLPKVEHPYRPGEIACDIELPLWDRHGDGAFVGYASNLEELEEVFQHWLAALTLPTRAREHPETYPGYVPIGEEAERIRVADHYVRKVFHGDLPAEQCYALLRAILRCAWFDIPPARLRGYFRRVMRNAAARELRSQPIELGGAPVVSLNETLSEDSAKTLMDVLPDQRATAEAQVSDERLNELWEFCASIPPSQKKLRKMAALLLESMDEKEAVRLYGRGGISELKLLKSELRAWREGRRRSMG